MRSNKKRPFGLLWLSPVSCYHTTTKTGPVRVHLFPLKIFQKTKEKPGPRGEAGNGFFFPTNKL
jgi:hypothetical protein